MEYCIKLSATRLLERLVSVMLCGKQTERQVFCVTIDLFLWVFYLKWVSRSKATMCFFVLQKLVHVSLFC